MIMRRLAVVKAVRQQARAYQCFHLIGAHMLRADIGRVIHKAHIRANGSLPIALTLDPSPTRVGEGSRSGAQAG